MASRYNSGIKTRELKIRVALTREEVRTSERFILSSPQVFSAMPGIKL